MSASRTALRLITLLFLLAGVLLLRKPVFGQPIAATPARQVSRSASQLIESATPSTSSNLHRSGNQVFPSHRITPGPLNITR
jgi:hypothetical protein